MKKFVIVTTASLCSVFLFAQHPTNFVIKGKIKNASQDFCDFGVSNLLDRELVSLPVNKEGVFFKEVPIKYTQDFFLHADKAEDRMLLFAEPGDTIEMSWDCENFLNTFQVTSAKAERQTELDLMRALSVKFWPEFTRMMGNLSQRSVSDSIKFEKVKDYCQRQIQFALSYPLTKNSRKILCDLYYQSITILYQLHLLPKYSLSLENFLPKNVCDSLSLAHLSVKSIDERLFYVSDTYRQFIFNQIRMPNGSPNIVLDSVAYATGSNERPNFTFMDCYAGTKTLALAPKVLDWFLAKAIFNGFTDYDFEGSEKAYSTYFPTIKTQMFHDTLQRFYDNIQRLKPGKQAPMFRLNNEKDFAVSLNDLKGKVIYIDFWGKYCGPCRYDIANYVPKLHEKYRGKNIVFLNICVDVDEKEWKETLNDLKLDGINLLAPGWTLNSVCKDYNVIGIPHYVLIDADGKIVLNNAERPFQLLQPVENAIDKLLKTDHGSN